ncbi:hypothetical protein ACFSQT_02125 [Mesorhizobium calcicola]|uniref:Uncharacterized protein n=1 Tax=Mesorhizobium calcicola TaxID=1300310 RepID=A0ABW4W8C8_9HYPH
MNDGTKDGGVVYQCIMAKGLWAPPDEQQSGDIDWRYPTGRCFPQRLTDEPLAVEGIFPKILERR